MAKSSVEERKTIMVKISCGDAVKNIRVLIALLIPILVFIYVFRLTDYVGLSVYKEGFLALFLALCVTYTFLAVDWRRRKIENGRSVPIIDLLLAALSLCVGGYIFFNYGDILFTVGIGSTLNTILGLLGIFMLLEATRRHAGFVLVILALSCLIYSYFGKYIPGPFQVRDLAISQILSYTYLASGATLGTPLFVAATIVAAFVLFGQGLTNTGGGDAISRLAFALMGKRRGGPAKVAVVASALFGSLSGSASANVATTGVITIPLMKRVGYRAPVAGAVEAVASTGGLILPPVMAATGFLMAEFLGLPYYKIALAATLPAIIYYSALYIQVDLEAAKDNLILKENDLQTISLRESIKDFIPVGLAFAALLFAMFGLFWDPTAAAFLGFFVTIGISLITRSDKKKSKLETYRNILSDAGAGIVFITIVCSIAGIVIGNLDLSGLGTNLARNIIGIADGNRILLLIISAIACIIIGMGVPVTATYIVLIILIGPALIEVGFKPLAAHMFIFYFGTLSFLTPPVCLSVFVAASIAKSKIWSTALHSLRLAFVAYIVPFIFIYKPALLLDGDLIEIVGIFMLALTISFLFGISFVGYFKKPITKFMRIIIALAGLTLIYAYFYFDNWLIGATPALIYAAYLLFFRNRLSRYSHLI